MCVCLFFSVMIDDRLSLKRACQAFFAIRFYCLFIYVLFVCVFFGSSSHLSSFLVKANISACLMCVRMRIKRVQLKWYIMMAQSVMSSMEHSCSLSYKLKRSSFISQESIMWLIMFVQRMCTLLINHSLISSDVRFGLSWFFTPVFLSPLIES